MTNQSEIDDSPGHFWNDENAKGVYHLDVRQLLEMGGEPYSIIMSSLQKLMPGECLVLHAPFEPKPLMFQLERMNYSYELKKEGLDHCTLTIKKNKDDQS